MSKDTTVPFSKEDLLSLLTEEKERLALYTRLCHQYQIEPHPIAQATSQAKIQLLTELVEWKKVI